MSDALACPPSPPTTARIELLTVTLAPGTSLHRIYRGVEPVRFTRTRGANRFDPLPVPWAATQVLYAGSSPEVAISECVLRWHDHFTPGATLILEHSKIAGRSLVELRLRRGLTLVDLTGFGSRALRHLQHLQHRISPINFFWLVGLTTTPHRAGVAGCGPNFLLLPDFAGCLANITVVSAMCSSTIPLQVTASKSSARASRSTSPALPRTGSF